MISSTIKCALLLSSSSSSYLAVCASAGANTCCLQLGWEAGYEGNVLATEPLMQSKVCCASDARLAPPCRNVLLVCRHCADLAMVFHFLIIGRLGSSA